MYSELIQTLFILQVNNWFNQRRIEKQMKFTIQLVTNNILQQVPTIVVTTQQRTNCERFIFNMSEQFGRYITLHNIRTHKVSSVFFTKFSSEAFCGLGTFLLDLNRNNYNDNDFGVKLYLNSNSYQYMQRVKRLMGFRLLPFSLYNLESGQTLYGVKNQKQLDYLFQNHKKKFFPGNFTNQQLLGLLQNPLDASQNIEKNKSEREKKALKEIEKGKVKEPITFKNQNGKLSIFCNRSEDESQKIETYYNYIYEHLDEKRKVKGAQFEKVQQMNKIGPKQKGELFKNGSVTLKSGQVLNADQFYEKIEGTNAFILLHYKTIEHLKNLIKSQILTRSLQQNEAKKYFVVHIVEGNGQLIHSPQFLSLKRMFREEDEHIIHNPYIKMYASLSELKGELVKIYPTIAFNTKLNMKSSGFIVDFSQNIMAIYERYANLIFQGSQDKNERFINCKPSLPLHEITLLPEKKKGYNRLNFLNFREFNLPAFSNSAIKNAQDVQVYQKLERKLLFLTQKLDPKVIIFGTSSMKATYFRNVSGLMVKMIQKCTDSSWVHNFSILMDCGDGTYNQFMNHFGVKYQQQIIKVKVLFLSHSHQDHCNGVFYFLHKREEAINRKYSKQQLENENLKEQLKLFLIIPENMVVWFDIFSSHIQFIQKYVEIVFCQSLLSEEVASFIKKFQSIKLGVFGSKQKQAQEFKRPQVLLKQCLLSQEDPLEEDITVQGVQQTNFNYAQCLERYRNAQNVSLANFKAFLSKNRITQFLPIPVYHCNQSYGLVVEHQSAIKISYSGDCRPSSLFIKAARYSTLMIHQATFGSQQKQIAKLKLHSTVSQAIQVGFKSDSLMTALTHFSSKNVKKRKQIKVKNVDPTYVKNNVFKCMDHLEFKISQMHKLPYIMTKLGDQY